MSHIMNKNLKNMKKDSKRSLITRFHVKKIQGAKFFQVIL